MKENPPLCEMTHINAINVTKLQPMRQKSLDKTVEYLCDVCTIKGLFIKTTVYFIFQKHHAGIQVARAFQMERVPPKDHCKRLTLGVDVTGTRI